MDIRGFLRWQFEGTFRSLSFYGFFLAILSLLAAVSGCAKPWPAVIFLVGFGIIFIDAARSWFRFSYSIYQLERRQIERELQRKE